MTALVQVPREAQQLPATLDKAEQAITLAKTPEEIKGVMALMDAAVAYAKSYYKDQQDVIQRAKALRLQAERKLGELLREMPKQSGARGVGPNGIPKENSNAPKLADIGIDAKTSMRAQRLAALPEKKFAAVVAGEIPVTQAIAKPKKETAKSRAAQFLQEQKIVAMDEGGTYLITVMRNALKAIENSGESVEQLDKAIAMAEKLRASLDKFLQAHANGL